jgi:hypothetical protein
MATYKMDDGTVVKPENATARYGENQDRNGSNHIGRISCSQWQRHDTNEQQSSAAKATSSPSYAAA